MIDYRDPTIFETYNARKLTPSQVAQTFMPPHSFFEIVKRINHIVVGPRGSGKTTLLKMLQLSALQHWKHEQAEEITKNIDYLSVFIPSDKVWEKDFELVDSLKINEHKKKLIKHTIFTTHTLLAILTTFRSCLDKELEGHENLKKFYIDLQKNDEAEIVDSLCELLDLNVRISSLNALETRLEHRAQFIGEIVNIYVDNTTEFDDSNCLFINKPYMPTIVSALKIINRFTNKNEMKWALTYDELEIAPIEIREILLNNLRSSDQILLFKLSFYPYTEEFKLFNNPQGAHEKNDYTAINLTYAYKRDAREFCQGMYNQICNVLGLDGIESHKVFGYSEFELGNVDRQRGNSAYIDSTTLTNRFISLEKKDKTFKYHLKNKKINLTQLEGMNDIDRAMFLRKITNLVSVRDTFLGDNSSLKSRRQVDLYTGDKTLFDITEGNPRVFLNVVSPLLQEYARSRLKVQTPSQKTNVYMAKDRFLSLLHTIPVPDSCRKYGYIGLNQFVKEIGDYFFKKVVTDSFNADAPLSFFIDKNTPIYIQEMVGNALNAGAFIHIPKKQGNTLLKSLENERFRLSYLLAPEYGLPLFVGPERALSNILDIKPPKAQIQPSLFDSIVLEKKSEND